MSSSFETLAQAQEAFRWRDACLVKSFLATNQKLLRRTVREFGHEKV